MPGTVTYVLERSLPESTAEGLPALVHEGWADAFPWLVQGTTTRGSEGEPFDLGLFSGGAPEPDVRANWETLARATGASTVVHARQEHGADVRVWEGGPAVDGHEPARGVGPTIATAGGGEEGEGAASVPVLVDACDGHATDRPGVLLAVTTADCVPVFVVDPRRRAVVMLHGGWRGVAAGILERGLEVMRSSFGTDTAELHLHLGPAICGDCYEVGPEVFEALARPVPSGPTPIDLRTVLAERAVEAGVPTARVSISGHCTLCTGSDLFSHRGGDLHRQVGYLGVRG